jgi:hypothetical protein
VQYRACLHGRRSSSTPQQIIMVKCENKNALKHGAFAEVVILPDEDPNELKELRAALYDEWNPEGPTEIHKVDSIAMGMWRGGAFSGICKERSEEL